jgi:3-oxoacyl-[acyl-carrier protein] reductase
MGLDRLKGRVAIVTGAGRGIGRAIACKLAEEGARVLVADLDRQVAEETARLAAAAGGEARPHVVDVRHAAEIEAMVQAAVAAWGNLHILCSNAGIFPAARLEEMSEEEWDRVQAINLKAAFLATKAALPHLRKAGHGRIVITSSITGPITGYPGWSHYGATKAGLLGFMRSAALELAKAKVTVNAVMPGNIMTEGMRAQPADYIRETERAIPMGHLGDPEDIAHAVVFLASDEARYITGQGIVIDGGQTLPESRLAID